MVISFHRNMLSHSQQLSINLSWHGTDCLKDRILKIHETKKKKKFRSLTKMFLFKKYRYHWQCWGTSLIPGLQRQRQADLWVRGQPGLKSEFQDSQCYKEKHCLWKKKNKKQKKVQIYTFNSRWKMEGQAMVVTPGSQARLRNINTRQGLESWLAARDQISSHYSCVFQHSPAW